MLYPSLTPEIAVFLLITFAVSFLLLYAEWLTWKEPVLIVSSWWTNKRVRRVAVLIYLFVIIEMFHNGGVPVILIFSGVEYDYRNFGIPTLHVVLYGIYWFLCVHWFFVWLKSRQRYYLYYSLLLLAINFLLVNRGALIQALLAWGLLLLAHRGMSVKVFGKMLVCIAMLVWGFGGIGDARMKSMGLDPNYTILAVGDASPKYPIDELGTGPFWFYLYTSSPLANWQINVTAERYLHADWWSFVVTEIMPDFIGKHFLDDSVPKVSPRLITSALTVTSAYGRAYFLKGWVGAAVIYCLLLVYYFLSRAVFRGSEYFFSGMATLSAGAALMIFYNMLSFTGLIGPLLVAVTLRFSLRRKRTKADQGVLRARVMGT